MIIREHGLRDAITSTVVVVVAVVVVVVVVGIEWGDASDLLVRRFCLSIAREESILVKAVFVNAGRPMATTTTAISAVPRRVRLRVGLHSHRAVPLHVVPGSERARCE
jgi:hypothetical protein